MAVDESGAQGKRDASVYVSDNEVLNELCGHWSRLNFIAIDTEFIRTNTFYPKAGLIQICDGGQSYLIDPLTINDWSALRELIVQTSVVKVFHSCSEDLLVFFSFLGVFPDPLFDTQIAAAFLNYGISLSYQNLVREYLGIEIPKDETRSDWLQRPLSEEQLSYAALDVTFLPRIYEMQCADLAERGLSEWVVEEYNRCIRQYDNENSGDYSAYYLSIKGVWQLNRRALAVLKELATWRECNARERDRPRSWIVKDQQLLSIANRMPDTRQQLEQIEGLSPNFIRHAGDKIVGLVRKALELAEDDLPSTLPRPMSQRQKTKLKAAQEYIAERAVVLGIPPELLGRKRLLVALYSEIIAYCKLYPGQAPDAESIALPDELCGWRKDLLLDDLLEILG